MKFAASARDPPRGNGDPQRSIGPTRRMYRARGSHTHELKIRSEMAAL